MAKRSNSSKKNTRRIQDVRITDEYAGTDGAKFDRVLSQLQNSHSQVTLCCTDEFGLSVATSPTSGILAGSQIRLFDEFVALGGQFQTFRIKRIRFDIYDLLPNLGSLAVWSTFHDVNTTGSQYVPSPSNTIDAPDSQIVAPGMGKISLFWTAKGTTENEFQSTNVGSGAPAMDFGGLRYYIAGAGAAVPNRFQVFVKAIVDFRGRE
jgi:hypothetical protein